MENEPQDDDLIAVCSECKSDVPESHMAKDPFFRQGDPATCPYCGGVVVVMIRAAREAALRQIDLQRGLGN